MWFARNAVGESRAASLSLWWLFIYPYKWMLIWWTHLQQRIKIRGFNEVFRLSWVPAWTWPYDIFVPLWSSRCSMPVMSAEVLVRWSKKRTDAHSATVRRLQQRRRFWRSLWKRACRMGKRSHFLAKQMKKWVWSQLLVVICRASWLNSAVDCAVSFTAWYNYWTYSLCPPARGTSKIQKKGWRPFCGA